MNVFGSFIRSFYKSFIFLSTNDTIFEFEHFHLPELGLKNGIEGFALSP